MEVFLPEAFHMQQIALCLRVGEEQLRTGLVRCKAEAAKQAVERFSFSYGGALLNNLSSGSWSPKLQKVGTGDAISPVLIPLKLYGLGGGGGCYLERFSGFSPKINCLAWQLRHPTKKGSRKGSGGPLWRAARFSRSRGGAGHFLRFLEISSCSTFFFGGGLGGVGGVGRGGGEGGRGGVV